MGDRYEFLNPLIPFREGPFELLNRTAMGRFAITQFNLQLMDAVLSRLELLHLGTEPLLVSEAFVELSDLFTQDTDFFFQDLAGLLRGPTGF